MHNTVLLQEAVQYLITSPTGKYVDGTFGRGGHSIEILKHLSPEGTLLAVDRDPDSVACAKEIADGDPRFKFYKGLFSELPSKLKSHSMSAVDGILLDLGVSSPQVDDPERGFSFLKEGPLDMRMDSSNGITAAQWIASAETTEVEQVLRSYGEERHAKRIAKAIVKARVCDPILTTTQLSKIVSKANPSWEKNKHPATRSFQAIRIKINSELKELSRFLESVIQILEVGGRLVVISFHSLEDRLVKRFMRDMSRGTQFPKEFPVEHAMLNRRMRLLGKAIRPSECESKINPRARSAVMRVAEKIN